MKSLSKTLIQLALISLISISVCKDITWLDLAKKEVERLAMPYPRFADQLIISINTSGGFGVQYFQIEELDEQITNNDFPEELRNKIRSIVWTDSVEYQGFTFTQFDGMSILDESAGVIKKVNGRVDIFYFNSQTVASLRTPMNTIVYQDCVKFIVWDVYCEDRYIQVPRAFMISEISVINDALRSHAYEGLSAELNKQESLMYLGEIDVSELVNNEIINKQKQQNQEQINTVLEIYKHDKYFKQMPLNAKDLIKEIEENEFPSISPTHLEQFFDNFINNISHKILDDHSKILNIILKSLDSHEVSKIAFFKFFVTNNQSKLDLYYIFMNYNQIDENYSIIIKFMKTEIKINSSLLIIKINNDEMINYSTVQRDESKESIKDLTPLMNLFEIVCQYEE